MKINLDKISSVVRNANLHYEAELSKDIKAEEGAIIAVRVMEDKKTYNKLELISGRLSTLHKGDILAVALGSRRALKGFVGGVPEKLEVGDVMNLLNLGGVAGTCTSANIQEVGQPLKIKVLGAVTDGTRTLNIKQFTLFKPIKTLGKSAPLIVVSGTCMDVGKTTVAGEIIKHARRVKLKIFATKLAGIAALKDTENMRDYGAQKAVSFVDAGCASTINNKDRTVRVAKGAIQYLSKDNPDYIVIEFGDGIFGEYGVLGILKDPEIQKHIVAHVGCAHDPVGAIKLAETCKEIGAPLDMISGPVTDNSVGTGFLEKKLHIAAFNAFTQSKLLFDHLAEKCLKLKK